MDNRSGNRTSNGPSGNLYYDDGRVTIYHGDCAEVLEDLHRLHPRPVEPFDVVLTDPPYNVKKDYGGHIDNMGEAEYVGWLKHRLTLATADCDRLIYTPGVVNLPLIERTLPVCFRWHRTLAWHKREFAGDMWNGGPAMCWEPVVWATREDKPGFNKTFGHWGRDFLIVPSVKEDPYRKLHPCPKPLSVMKWLVGLFVPEDGLMLDPFMGVGTSLVAARNAGARAIGIEINEEFCELAAKRLEQGSPKDPSQEAMAV